MSRTEYNLISHVTADLVEAGCDEAGRGCLAGPVFAAAVILPRDFRETRLTDSKKLSEKQRNSLRLIIEKEAIDWAVAMVDAAAIDRINILNASILAMHEAIGRLRVKPGLLLIDGNRFKPYAGIDYQCMVRGDARFLSIAAASVLAKTHRDEFMCLIDQRLPAYNWRQNKGYPTMEHREAIGRHGFSVYHRLTFRTLDSEGKQLNINLSEP